MNNTATPVTSNDQQPPPVNLLQWQRWDGGVCPVAEDTRVEIVLRDGTIAIRPAMNVDWQHRRVNAHPSRDDVVLFRIATEGVGPYVPRSARAAQTPPAAHSHYFKDVRHLDTIDVYRVLSLFGVTDPCLQHAIKKLLVAGGRGAGKDVGRDVQEAIDSLVRWQTMRKEDGGAK